jgi:hypothetical protein
MTKYLIVANQTIGGSELTAAVTERVEAGPCEFHLVVPVPPIPPSAVAVGLAAVESAATAIFDLPDQRLVAQERLDNGLKWLTGLGAVATGEVGTADTVEAVTTVVERDEIEEIIVSTLPSRLSRWLHQDLPRKIEKHVTIPVVVVTAVTASDRAD